MTKLGRVRRGGILVLCALSIGAWSIAMAGPPDEETPKPTGNPAPPPPQASEFVDVIGSDDPAHGLGIGGRMRPMAECMSVAAAVAKKDMPLHGPPGDGLRQTAMQSKAIPECPAATWVWVGAGHGGAPVGYVSTPLTVATTRKRRRHHKHDCCYLVQNSPGSPNG